MSPRTTRAAVGALLCAWAGLAAGEQPAEVNYMIHCMGCHLVDGSGSPPQVPDVRGEMGRLLGVDGGREYLVQIPGAATAPVSDGELAAIINYMLSAFSRETLPASYEPFSESEVKRLRLHWLSDPEPVRRRLLDQLE